MWCLGNEMDGPWQTGHKTAKEYGRLAAETARAMRQIDPDLELVACGSSNSSMPTFGEWERIVLEETYEQVDYISAHTYYYEENGDMSSFLASAIDMDQFIEAVAATADSVKAAGRHEKDIQISFDEWNVWYQKRAESHPPEGDDWPVAPKLLEDNYNVADAVVVGNCLISLLRHTDRVHSASLAQLVNVIAPIMCETETRAWKQTTFHPFAQASNMAKGDVLNVRIDSPSIETKRFGDAPLVDAVATYDEVSGETVVFAVNRDQEGSIELNLDFRGDSVEIIDATSYHSEDIYWQASLEDDTSVVPQANETVSNENGSLTIQLPAVSWNTIRIKSK